LDQRTIPKKLHLQTVNVRRVFKDRAELIKHHDAGEEAENQRLNNVENRKDGRQRVEIALRVRGRCRKRIRGEMEAVASRYILKKKSRCQKLEKIALHHSMRSRETTPTQFLIHEL
jgi:hypothetical protein